MRLAFDECSTLPKLAWVAVIRRNEGAATVIHGPWVETCDDRFFEGAWDGDFHEGAFDDALSFFGSGGRLAGNGVLFAGPTHKFERIQSVLAGDTLYVSNSLVLLLTQAGEDLDLKYSDYLFDYLRYFRAGIRLKVKPIRLRSGNSAYLHDCCNLSVQPDLTITRIEKRYPSPPSRFRDYSDFLDNTARQLAANAANTGRKQPFRPVAAISRGYDSVAVAAVASRAGCRRAVTFKYSGGNQVEDSGAAIAAHLGMEVTERERGALVDIPGLPDVEFFPNPTRSGKALALFEDELTGSLYFNGSGGEDNWDKNWETGAPLLQEPTAFSMAGSNITEFRLRIGMVYVPLACSGAIHAPVLARINRSSEMKNWSLGGRYDRPIPRRLAEERGVPRSLFGRAKVGGAPRLTEFGLSPQGDAEFRKFLREVIQKPSSSSAKNWRRSNRFRWLRPFRRLLYVAPWFTSFFRHIVGDRLDPRWKSAELYTFHWSFYRMRERYVQSLAGLECSEPASHFRRERSS